MKPAELDKILPRVKPGADEIHLHAAVLETASPADLIGLATDPKLRRHLLGRLSDTVALVDPGAADALEEALKASGHTPKISIGSAG